MFIKCSCHGCGQNIEFSTDDFQEDHRTATSIFGQLVPCPSCANETRLYIPQPPASLPATNRRPESVRKRLVIFGIIIAAVTLCFAIGWALNKFAEQIATVVGGGIGLTVTIAATVFVVVLALFWILFPIVMYFQLKRSNELLERIERNSRTDVSKKDVPAPARVA